MPYSGHIHLYWIHICLTWWVVFTFICRVLTPSNDILNLRKLHTFSMFSHELSDSDSDYEEDIQLTLLTTFLTKKRKWWRYWIYPVNKKREVNGEFHCLIKELCCDAEKFHQYFRLSKGIVWTSSFFDWKRYNGNTYEQVKTLHYVQGKHFFVFFFQCNVSIKDLFKVKYLKK